MCILFSYLFLTKCKRWCNTNITLKIFKPKNVLEFGEPFLNKGNDLNDNHNVIEFIILLIQLG